MNTSLQGAPGSYDARWFIWTIVFLVVTGISLVSYIVLSDNSANDVPIFANVQAVRAAHKSALK